MMGPMDEWVTLKKITPAESQDHSINIDKSFSKPLNPLQLPDSIQ
jgi:hypothetical protein